MNRKTKLVIGSAQLACALVFCGCGAAPDATQTYDTEEEVGLVSEALTTFDNVGWFGGGMRLDWAEATLFVSTNADHSWVELDIFNHNQARLHMRKINFEVTCSNLNSTQVIGPTLTGNFTFSTYVEPNGGTYHQHMDCATWFGYRYLINWKMHSESSFGD
jgi:hypothetical protein